jgi:hypothetical protein
MESTKQTEKARQEAREIAEQMDLMQLFNSVVHNKTRNGVSEKVLEERVEKLNACPSNKAPHQREETIMKDLTNIKVNEELFHHDIGVFVEKGRIIFSRSWFSYGISVYANGRIKGDMKKFTVAQINEIIRVRAEIMEDL